MKGYKIFRSEIVNKAAHLQILAMFSQDPLSSGFAELFISTCLDTSSHPGFPRESWLAKVTIKLGVLTGGIKFSIFDKMGAKKQSLPSSSA